MHQIESVCLKSNLSMKFTKMRLDTEFRIVLLQLSASADLCSCKLCIALSQNQRWDGNQPYRLRNIVSSCPH